VCVQIHSSRLFGVPDEGLVHFKDRAEAPMYLENLGKARAADFAPVPGYERAPGQRFRSAR
jgi:hypothetical protein